MTNNSRLIMIFLMLTLSACKTSGDLHSGPGSDPGEIRTVTNPVYETTPQRDPIQLEKELAITKGSYEELKYTSEQEKAALQNNIAKLEKSNAQLIQELEKLQWTGFSEGSESSAQNSAELMWQKANENLSNKKYDRASSLFNVFSKTYPKDPAVFYSKVAHAMIFYNQAKYRRALIAFNKVIDNYPDHKRVSLAWFGQGAAFAKNGQDSDAKLFFEEAARRSPKSSESKWANNILKKKASAPDDIFEAIDDWGQGAPYSSAGQKSALAP